MDTARWDSRRAVETHRSATGLSIYSTATLARQHAMHVTVRIPFSLRVYCQGAPREIILSATTVRGAMDELERRYPAVHTAVRDETGAVRPHIHLFVNSSFVRDRDRLDTILRPGDVLSIMTAVSGG